MIFNTVKSLEGEDVVEIDWTMIKKLLKILAVLLEIFTIIFFTFFGCFLVLNDSNSWIVQTVILSSEGAANVKYPDSLGEYQLAGEIRKFQTVYNWYRHKDREDRFLMYNNLGNIELNTNFIYILCFYVQIIVGTLPLPMKQKM